MYNPLFVGVLCLSLFCYVLLYVHSSFANILKRKRKLAALLVLSYRCIVTINAQRLFLMVQTVGLQCVIVVFPGHTHLLFERNCIFFHGKDSWICCQIISKKTFHIEQVRIKKYVLKPCFAFKTYMK